MTQLESVMLDDKHLKQAVLDELDWEPSVNSAHIGVTAKNGIVALHGHVENFWGKSAAEKAARRVKGVKAVAEELDVRLPLGVQHDDEEIASAAVDRLTWNSNVPKDTIKVKVEKGWITLTGEVVWHYQQNAAADDVRGLWGVVGIHNQITIRSRPDTSKIKSDILVALDRSWFHPADIHVSASGGIVTLSGSVDSFHEREEASSTAWAAPGTTSVANDISIT